MRNLVVSALREIEDITVYQAENGVVALQLMAQHSIDAVIADIRMPVMDGLKFLEHLRTHQDKTPVAILSGHDEFEYAQLGMRYDAFDYLLKPVSRDDLQELSFRMIRYLRSQKNLEKEMNNLLLRVEEARPYIRQRFFDDLTKGLIDEAAFNEMVEFLNLQLRWAPVWLALIEVDELGNEYLLQNKSTRLKLYSVLSAIQKICRSWQYCESCTIADNSVLVIWCPPAENYDENYFPENLDLLLSEITMRFGIDLNIGLTDRLENPLLVKEGVEDARRAIRNKLLYGSGQIFETFSDSCVPGSSGAVRMDTGALMESIWMGNSDAAQEQVAHIFNKIFTAGTEVRVSSISLFCQKLLIDSLRILEEECGDISGIVDPGLASFNFFQYSQSGIILFFQDLVSKIANRIYQSRQDRHKDIVAQAKSIIHKNLASEVNVTTIAQELHFSKNYLGQLFRMKSGMTINEYINFIRVEKSKKLLLDGKLKIYEIAEAVGYSDQSYFTRVFKRVVGCLPTEYRRQVGG